MPNDSVPAAQIAQGQRYVKEHYGPQDSEDKPPGETEVTCTGGMRLPVVGARSRD